MQRSRTVIVTSHCVINQNAVVGSLARSRGMMKSAVDWMYEQGYGIIQLPCPEFTFLGPTRPPMTVAGYDTPEFRAHSRKILSPVIEQLKVYQDNGYAIAGGLAIAGSPSCDPGQGVFMQEFQTLISEAGIRLDFFWQIPKTADGVFNPAIADSVYGPVDPRSRHAGQRLIARLTPQDESL
ncbi:MULTISPECIES: CD3072 family TudS-related putative desulfidase [unclassified Brenneria]|uniref:CD3072 family TudS-related putative desulfidase n=1 Tax=unclassified Brenneria TaxID=2634434 RepID=UPI0029C205EE|nr:MULTISPECIES: CD3072 family TudS-related putative desulfidase [unclassified Brenneria]MDX5627019.1 hypothetical protein [Brenneria sp. L3-3Z]MDX5693631.1 hypothetical protein [Brenneria sp. L4-2C]